MAGISLIGCPNPTLSRPLPLLSPSPLRQYSEKKEPFLINADIMTGPTVDLCPLRMLMKALCVCAALLDKPEDLVNPILYLCVL